MGEDRFRILLKVVGRQEVVIRTDKGLEEPPGAARRRAQDPGVPRRQEARRISAQGQADPSGDQRRQSPEQDERRGDRPALRPHQGHQRPGRAGQDQRAAHPPIRAGDVEGESGLGLRRGRPFEHRSTGQAEPDERPPDRVPHQPRLVGQKRHPEPDLGGADGHAPSDGAEVGALRDPPSPRDHLGERRQARRGARWPRARTPSTRAASCRGASSRRRG